MKILISFNIVQLLSEQALVSQETELLQLPVIVLLSSLYAPQVL